MGANQPAQANDYVLIFRFLEVGTPLCASNGNVTYNKSGQRSVVASVAMRVPVVIAELGFRRRVLIVDDDRDFADSTADLLAFVDQSCVYQAVNDAFLSGESRCTNRIGESAGV